MRIKTIYMYTFMCDQKKMIKMMKMYQLQIKKHEEKIFFLFSTWIQWI